VLIVGFGLLVDVILCTNDLATFTAEAMPPRMARSMGSIFQPAAAAHAGLVGTLVVFILWADPGPDVGCWSGCWASCRASAAPTCKSPSAA
jgi:hypothetical protein